MNTNRMENAIKRLAVLACLFGCVCLLRSGLAAEPASPTLAKATAVSSPNPGLLNEWLRRQSTNFGAFDLGGQVRVRGEHKENIAVPGLRPEAVDFRAEGGAGNTYLLLREKLHLGYKPADWLNAYVEGRDSSSHYDRREPNPETDRFDLHQAFLGLGDPDEFPLLAKVGRQEFSYGDERLIGAFDWNNIGRVFDAAKLRFEQSSFWVDAFVGRVIIPDDGNFNVANDYDIFSGLYASSRELLRNHESQAYFLSRNTGLDSPNAIGSGLPPFMQGASPRDIYTVGLRLKSLAGRFNGWDYETELAGQFGNFKAASGERLEQQAFAVHAAGGYTFADCWGSPRLGLEYNFSTGDSDPNDDTHETFDNLFPTNHRNYGYMDFFSWQNMHNARLATSIRPWKKLLVTLDFHGFWLADTHDYFYQANGAPRTTGGYGINPDAGNFVGMELDFVGTWKLAAYASVQAGYGHFFARDYIRDSLAPVGGATDANWVYAQVVFNF